MTPTYYVHPEFGYFCPGPRARRELRVAVVSILFGMVIGAAIVTVDAGHAVETDGVSSNAHLKSSSSDPLLPGSGGPSSQFKDADSAKAGPVEAIKPFPTRMVRVRSSKSASALAGVPLVRTPQPEPSPSAGPTPHENEEASVSAAASPAARRVAAAAEPAISKTKKRPSAMHARRHWDDANENVRWQSWGERAYAEERSWRGAYRNWVYR